MSMHDDNKDDPVPVLTEQQIRAAIERGAERAEEVRKYLEPSFRLPASSRALVLR